MAAIVYSGDEIVAFYHQGYTDYLLVTFSELHHERLGEGHYFAKPLVERADISCIGVINTVKAFYLSAEMENVVRIVDQVRGDRKVIVFGQSMGGYAAIKHAAALRADYVIACSPFFSMDPDELELPTDRHRHIMMQSMQHHGVVQRPEFKGMGLKASDCAGRIIALYDPFDSVDTFASALLRKHLPMVEFITVPLASHEIYNGSWTSKLFATLIEALRSDDRTAFAREMNTIRRETSQFMLRTIHKAAHQKPEMCVRAFRSPRILRNADYKAMLADPINMILIYRLFARGRRVLAGRHFALVAKEVLQLDLGGIEVAEGPVLETTIGSKLCLLMSFHGSFLAYDLNTRSVCLDRNVFRRPDLVPIHAKLANGAWSFYIRSESREITIAVSAIDPSFTSPELVASSDHTVAVRSGDRYLSVNHAGALQIVPQILSEQERFVPLPISDHEAVVKAGAINWFDQVVMTQPSAPLPFSNDTAATRAPRTNRWLKLFARN